jgi:hypothetical protein
VIGGDIRKGERRGEEAALRSTEKTGSELDRNPALYLLYRSAKGGRG